MSAISEHGISLTGNENVLKLIVMMVEHLCEYSPNHQTVYFQCMNYTSIKWSFKKDHYGKKLSPCVTCLEGKKSKSTSLNKSRFAKNGKTEKEQNVHLG